MANTTFDTHFDITSLKGAEYNPRTITEQDLLMLQESVRKLGIVKPIITNGTTIVAGHQRTKALLSQGIKTAPVISLDTQVNTYDEIRFNQLHNGTDLDCGDEHCTVDLTSTDYTVGDFIEVKPSQIKGNLRCQYAPVRREISRLISLYGNWGAVVATESGEVIHAAQYALSCIITQSNLLVYIIKNSDKDLYQSYLNKSYGVFSYDHLDKDTYIQTLAQMMRLRSGKQNNSTLYEQYVLKQVGKKDRLLDFGSGQGDYAKRLRKAGYNILDIELFRRKGAGNTFNLTAIHRMIDEFIADYQINGKLDGVICDSVMNSVDCDKAELSILDFLNYIVKDGGKLYISGRPRSVVEGFMRMTKLAAKKRVIEFLDDKGYSAIYRKGHWFYQKFHTEQQVRDMLDNSGFDIEVYKNSGSSWQCVAVKRESVSNNRVRDAISYEFNLPISKDKTINKHEDVLRILGNG